MICQFLHTTSIVSHVDKINQVANNSTLQIIMVDYFIIRRGNIHVPSLYDGRPRSLYWFTSGVHIPGIVAWCVGVSFGLPGLVGSYEPAAVNQSAKDMYKIGWILYASAAALTYYVMVTFLERPAVLPEIEGDQPGDWVVPVEVSLPSSKKS